MLFKKIKNMRQGGAQTTVPYKCRECGKRLHKRCHELCKRCVRRSFTSRVK